MKIAFRDSFAKDLQSIRDKAVLKRIKEIIEAIELSDSLSDLPNLKKLKGHENYYRLGPEIIASGSH